MAFVVKAALPGRMATERREFSCRGDAVRFQRQVARKGGVSDLEFVEA